MYATYLDFTGAIPVVPNAIAVDSQGRAWVVGPTCACPAGGAACGATPVLIPGTLACAYGTASAIRELDANGAELLVSMTFGGGPAGRFLVYRDSAMGVAIDAADSAWVVGTAETNLVPTTPNALEPQRSVPSVGGGSGLGYVLKLSPSGGLLYGTYVGTDAGDAIASVAVDQGGRPYFALNSRSVQVRFPCAAAVATVMALSGDGSTILASRDLLTPVGTIALDGSGGLYAAGFTQTLAFLTTPGTLQPFYPGGSNSGFLAKLDLTASAPQLRCVVNAASLRPGNLEGAVAPGEIVTLAGKDLPANSKVSFDGHPAPILYADANQINAVVPYELSAPTATVSVEGAGGFVLPVFPAIPALFTADSSGSGPVAALNQDGTVNSSNNPAKAGSIISVYMTGLGIMTPPLADGQLGPLQPPFPVPLLGVGATVNGVITQVLFAGQAPGLIAGAVQVNLRIPLGTVSGNGSLIVYVGNYRSQTVPTTIAVQ